MNPEPMTGEQYADADGAVCPWCRNRSIEAGSPDFDGSIALVPVHCLACARRWTDEYRLTGYSADEE